MLSNAETAPSGLSALLEKAEEAGRVLKAVANANRLVILCKLIEAGEMNVSRLCEEVGLSQSALSQHLALLRSEGLVGFRREAQTLFYRIEDRRVAQLISSLKDTFCPNQTKG